MVGVFIQESQVSHGNLSRCFLAHSYFDFNDHPMLGFQEYLGFYGLKMIHPLLFGQKQRGKI